MSLQLVTPGAFHDAYDRIRSENALPRAFGTEALEEAFASAPDGSGRRDMTDIPFVAIDPPGAADLDQAVHIETTSSGHRVLYAIADIGAFITPGGALDSETKRRGVTMYFPDGRVPLHPRVLSEDRASLLAGRERLAVVWTMSLDEEGKVETASLERAIVRVSEAISYQEAQRRRAGDSRIAQLEVVGRRRMELEAGRGGISLEIPGQRVAETSDGYTVEYEETLPVERWNAQISIMTGVTAARALVDAGLGMVRTLPEPRSDDLTELRHRAKALGIDWPASTAYSSLLRSLDHGRPHHVAFKYAALRTLRGAGYAPVSDRPLDRLIHGAIGDLYAHVTAPLRRLGDRHVNEILLAIYADREPAGWAVEASASWLAGAMVEARARQASIDRQVVDHTEAAILSGRSGEVFEAVVVRRQNGRVRVQLADPAVVADIETAGVDAGDRVSVRLDRADPVSGEIIFSLASA